jgi:1-acyl-sn-glycerol-3-phosphate acyltransferase
MFARLWTYLKHLLYRLWRFWIEIPFFCAGLIVWVLYRFQIRGAENLPTRGPVILAVQEHSLISVLVSGYVAVRVINRALDKGLNGFMGYMQEELFALKVFRKLRQRQAREQFGALLPHSAGKLALSLLDGYHVLRAGGMVIMNPEGDVPWDGRPLPLGGGLAWLGLHSGAPIVPALCSPGAYDIWPRWSRLPSLHGRMTVRVGEPILLATSGNASYSEADAAAANIRIRAEFDKLHYGTGGVEAWMGKPTRYGETCESMPPVALLHPVNGDSNGNSSESPARSMAASRWGIGQVLWRCPVCHAEDAIRMVGGLLQKMTVRCVTCDTRWTLKREYERDFRLCVIKGPDPLLGLEMALAAWYDGMKCNFKPALRQVDGANLMPDEEAYLAADGVSLLPYRPNPLFDGWSEREAPRKQPGGHHELADWASAGKGRLVLTSRRLLWQGAEREVDFYWHGATAVYLWLQNTLGIRYGAAPYRFKLAKEPGLKWLTYAGTLAKEAAARTGRKLMTSDY